MSLLFISNMKVRLCARNFLFVLLIFVLIDVLSRSSGLDGNARRYILNSQVRGREGKTDALFKKATGHKRKVVVVCCKKFCGGYADRLRGLSLALDVAIRYNRTLSIDNSLFRRPGDYPTCKYAKPFLKIVGRALSKKDDAVLKNNTRVVYMQSNQVAKQHMTLIPFILKRFGYIPCEQFLHTFVTSLYQFVYGGARPGKIVAMHTRVGGASFQIEDCTVKGVPWSDGHVSNMTRDLLNDLRTYFAGFVCKVPLILVSDSPRFVGEVKFALSGSVNVYSQGGNSGHIERSKGVLMNGSECTEELMDMATIGHADAVFKSAGGFADMATTIFGDKSKTKIFDVRKASTISDKLRKELECRN